MKMIANKVLLNSFIVKNKTCEKIVIILKRQNVKCVHIEIRRHTSRVSVCVVEQTNTQHADSHSHSSALIFTHIHPYHHLIKCTA